MTDDTHPATTIDRAPHDITPVITEGLAANTLLPPPERLAHLDRLLRAELERLITTVQMQADQLDRGTLAWDACQRLIRGARRSLEGSDFIGWRHAALRVQSFAQYCQWLAEYTDTPYREPAPTPAPEQGSGHTGVCASCEGAITPDDVCDVHPIYTASGGGTDIYYHRECPLPRRSTPAY